MPISYYNTQYPLRKVLLEGFLSSGSDVAGSVELARSRGSSAASVGSGDTERNRRVSSSWRIQDGLPVDALGRARGRRATLEGPHRISYRTRASDEHPTGRATPGGSHAAARDLAR